MAILLILSNYGIARLITQVSYENMQGIDSMEPSKLEVCLAILRLLIQNGPSKSAKVLSAGKNNRALFKKSIELLVDQGLIEEKISYDKALIYDVTNRGRKVSKFFILPPEQSLRFTTN